MNQSVAPKELIDQCEMLSQNIGGFDNKYVARPYLDDGGEYHEPEWKIRIIDCRDDSVVTEHLVPEYCNWHTLHVMLTARYRHGRAEFQRGKEDAVNKLCTHFKELVK